MLSPSFAASPASRCADVSAAAPSTLPLTPGTGLPKVPILQYLLGMLAVSRPQSSGRPKLSWTTMSKPARNLATGLASDSERELHRKTVRLPNPRDSRCLKRRRWKRQTLVLTSWLCSCFSQIDIFRADKKLSIFLIKVPPKNNVFRVFLRLSFLPNLDRFSRAANLNSSLNYSPYAY